MTRRFTLTDKLHNQLDAETVTGTQATTQVQPKSEPFSNLGAGEASVTLLVSSFFAARIVCNLTAVRLVLLAAAHLPTYASDSTLGAGWRCRARLESFRQFLG